MRNGHLNLYENRPRFNFSSFLFEIANCNMGDQYQPIYKRAPQAVDHADYADDGRRYYQRREIPADDFEWIGQPSRKQIIGAKMLALIEKGKSAAQIAEVSGFSVGHVHRLLKYAKGDAGVKDEKKLM